MQAERTKQVESFLKDTLKTYGQGSVYRGNSMKADVDVISTGSLKIDIDTGIGGIPKGRFTEILGAESSGKTTIALHGTANVQKVGGSVFYVDMEHALDPVYATNLGVKLDELAVSQPDNAEQAMDLIKSALTLGAFDLIVLDSVAALVPRAHIEGEMGDAHMGIEARLMSKACKQFAPLAHSSNTAMVWINQMRSGNFGGYGPSSVPTGGNALKYYSSLRIQTTRGEIQKDDGEASGNKVKVKIIKNKLASPFKECEPEIVYGEGFDLASELIDLGADEGFLVKGGAWYTIGTEKIQGKDSARQYLLANPTIMEDLEVKIRAKFNLK